MKHSHTLICVLLVAVGIALAASGAGAAAFIPAIACMAMMGAMVWMMLRPSGDGDR